MSALNPARPAAPRPNGPRGSRLLRLRRWLPYAGTAGVVALVVAGLWPRPVPVETARATTGALRATVNEEGKTRLKQRFVVSAPVSGQLRRIPFKAGAQVEAGQTVLAVLDPLAPVPLDARARALAEARKDAAAAQLEKARAARVYAVQEAGRIDRLHAAGAASPQERDTVKWRETTALREETAAESSLRQAEAELAVFATESPARAAGGPVEIKAPVSGRVLRVVEESSRSVAAGTPLAEIGDPADLEVVVDVLSRDGAVIAPGAPAELWQWGGEGPLAARVRLVEPSAFTKVSALGVEEQRVNVIADLVAPPEQRAGLGDRFRVEARIVVWETPNTLKAPVGALFRRGPDWAAFVVEAGRARLQTVRAGRSSGVETQILGGLKEGDVLILYPGDRVHDGQRVRVIEI